MANNTGPVRRGLSPELQGALAARSIADGGILFVVDGAGRYHYFDAELGALFAAGEQPTPGAPFRADAFIPVNRVTRAVADGLEGRVPTPCLVVSRESNQRGDVWRFEAFPVTAAELALGSGVACLLTRGPQELEAAAPAPADEALLERLERERLETTQAVAVTMRHEINNALTSLIGNAELILRRVESLDPVVVSRVEEIVRQGRRIQTVLDRLEALTEIRTTTYYGGVQMIELGDEDEGRK